MGHKEKFFAFPEKFWKKYLRQYCAQLSICSSKCKLDIHLSDKCPAICNYDIDFGHTKLRCKPARYTVIFIICVKFYENQFTKSNSMACMCIYVFIMYACTCIFYACIYTVCFMKN